MTTDLISHQLVRYLEYRDVKHVFGLCGHTNIAVLAALSKSDSIEFVNTRHEQLAAHAADGYARATNRASVVLSHLGPGLTNAATGVANAALDSVPMVVIAGDIPSHYYGKHPHQEVNLHAVARQQHGVAGLLQPLAQVVARLGLVFDDQQFHGTQCALCGRA